eukprot:gene13963-16054_t
MSEEFEIGGEETDFAQEGVDMSSKTTYPQQASDCEEKTEESDDESVKVSPEPLSYLPSWVLKMREKIATSRNAHADAELRITQLHTNVDNLSAKLLVMRPALLNSSKTSGIVAAEKITKKVHANYIYTIPTDILTLILEYLQIKQILRLDLISKSFRTMLGASNYWSEAFPLYCPHLQGFVSPSFMRSAQMKACLLQYVKDIQICMEFIQTMKDQRSVPKHRSVQPHRHTRQERQVSHPLPLFEQVTTSSARGGANASTNGGNEQGTSWGQRANALRSTDRIMSHAETLSSDFRSVAHKALHTMLILTSDCNDPTIYQLVSEGAVTILTALLLNEEGSIQNDACAIIANLLCWEARKRLLFRQNRSKLTKNTHALTPSPRTLRTLHALFGPAASDIDLTYPLRDQVMVCGGLKMLTSLLTSPSASINLASSTNNAYNSGKLNQSGKSASSAGSNNVNTSGSVKMSTTSSIQGICNKQASRALLALVYPEMPVSYGENINAAMHYVKENSDTSVAQFAVEKANIDLSVKKLSSTHSEGTLQLPVESVSVAPLLMQSPLSVSPHKIRLAPLPHTSNNNDNTTQDVTTTVELATLTAALTTLNTKSTTTATDTTPVQLRAPMISPLFLTDNAARPWLFSYFYKSGAVKDQFTAYLRFVPVYTTDLSSPDSKHTSMRSSDVDVIGVLVGAEVHGRGIDNIGAFTLTGKAQADINGWTWHVDKSYVPVTFDTGSVYLDNLNGVDTEHVNSQEGSALHWVHLNTNNSNNSSRATVHVRHVAYWSPGVQNTTYTDFNSSNTRATSASTTQADNVNTSSVGEMNSATTVSSFAVSELNHIDEEPTGIWGLGLWGVWETSSGTSPHFELQKGGVFRAAPIIL